MTRVDFLFLLHAYLQPASKGHDGAIVAPHVSMHRIQGIHPPLDHIEAVRPQNKGHLYFPA